MKQCKYCGTTKNLFRQKSWGKIVTCNMCVSCRKKKSINKQETLKKHSELYKGKSFIERYGEKKAKEVREGLSKSSSRTLEERCGKIVAKRLIKGHCERRKGKTNIKIFGKKKGEEINQNISKTQLGISFEKRFGNKKAEEMKENLRNIHLNKKYSKKDREKINKKIIKQHKGYHGLSKDEYKIIIDIEKKIEKTITKHYFIKNSFNEKFFIDGYLVDYNIAIEIDDGNHRTQKALEKDKIREEKIEKILHCKFVRIFKPWYQKYNNYKEEKINNIMELI